MHTLHSPGLMMPGQLGPMRRVFVERFSACFTRTMSYRAQKNTRYHTAAQGKYCKSQRLPVTLSEEPPSAPTVLPI